MLKWTKLTLHPQGFYGILILILVHLTFGFLILDMYYTSWFCCVFLVLLEEDPRPLRVGPWEQPVPEPSDELGRAHNLTPPLHQRTDPEARS